MIIIIMNLIMNDIEENNININNNDYDKEKGFAKIILNNITQKFKMRK